MKKKFKANYYSLANLSNSLEAGDRLSVGYFQSEFRSRCQSKFTLATS